MCVTIKSVTLSGVNPSGAIASEGLTKSLTVNCRKYCSRWNPESTTATRPSMPFSTQIIIAMSIRRSGSAPATRLATRKFAIVANRTAYNADLSPQPRHEAAINALTSERLAVVRRTRLLLLLKDASENFPDHRLRQLGLELDLRWHLVRRQPFPAEGAQFRLGQRLTGAQHDPGLDHLALRAVG